MRRLMRNKRDGTHTGYSSGCERGGHGSGSEQALNIRKPEISTGHHHQSTYTGEAEMTTIIIKPAKENAKQRRYRQRGELMAKRREDAELALKISKAWAKLTHIDLPKPKEPEYSGSCCLPNVAIYSAGHRKSEILTCRGTQKFKGKSIPLV